MNENKNQTLSKKISQEDAQALLWEDGDLSWLLHKGQIDLYQSYIDCKEKTVVWNCSRRFGKSWTLCVLAIETCLKTPNSLVKYCCAKQVDARGIIRPLIREITKTCPKDLRPVFKVQERAYVFPNGSRIELSGLDGGRAESIRGGSSNLAIIDEAGLVGDLEYIITSIILPTTLTTKGKIILASTPPKTAVHPFITKFLNKARIQGNLVTKTVFDNPTIDRDELDKIIDDYGGVDSVGFRREFLCHIIIDTEYAVIPEFTPELKEKVVVEWPRPPFYDGYVAMDFGVKDLTVVLFAYYDFKNAKLIVEDEYVINGQKFNTKTLAENIRLKEQSVYTDPYTGEYRNPFIRVSDNNLALIQDLRQLHGLTFLPTRKDDADAALNNLRNWIQDERIIINPRCKRLIAHLESAIWNKSKSSFDRSGDNGHFDAVDSLKYMIRNVQTGRNPYPPKHHSQDWHTIRKAEYTPQIHALKQALNIKK